MNNEARSVQGKDSERRVQYKKEACLFFVLPSWILSYEKTVKGERRGKRKTKFFSRRRYSGRTDRASLPVNPFLNHSSLLLECLFRFCSLSVPHPSLFRPSWKMLNSLPSHNKPLTANFIIPAASFPPRLQNNKRTALQGLLEGVFVCFFPVFVQTPSLVRPSLKAVSGPSSANGGGDKLKFW